MEVAGGILPRLGKRIAHYQKVHCGKGTITVYDPRISVYESDTDRLKFVRKQFHKDTDIRNTNLILGLQPCEATYALLDSAFQTKTDFMVALCEGGVHGEPYDFYEDADEWVHGVLCYTEDAVKRYGMGKMKVLSLKQYGDPWPVIYNHK